MATVEKAKAVKITKGIRKMTEKNGVTFICFGGEDWWYHNRGHIDFQLMRRFAAKQTVLYVNSIVMQKPRIGKGGDFFKKLSRKAKSIFKGLRHVEKGFWVYSPFTLPVHHLPWARWFNEMILRFQISLVAWKLGIHAPVIWVACPAACETAEKMKKYRLVYQRTDRHEDFPNVDKKVISGYDRRLKEVADLTVYVSHSLFMEEQAPCKRAYYLDHCVDF